VNHVVPLAVAPERRYDPGNLETLCHGCHLQAGREQRRA
jgi:5-methylcytosine-specific restriction endonuclease McrA